MLHKQKITAAGSVKGYVITVATVVIIKSKCPIGSHHIVAADRQMHQ